MYKDEPHTSVVIPKTQCKENKHECCNCVFRLFALFSRHQKLVHPHSVTKVSRSKTGRVRKRGKLRVRRLKHLQPTLPDAQAVSLIEQESDAAKAATDVEDTKPKDSETENEESEVEEEAGEDGGTDAEEGQDTEGDADEPRQVMHDFTFPLGETVRVFWPRLDEWILGKIQKGMNALVEVAYEEEDTYSVHRLRTPEIEKSSVE